MKNKKFIFILIFFLFHKISLGEEIPKITVEPTSFSKIFIRVPDFEGDKELSNKLTPLLRKLINYHLFTLALKNPPLPNSPLKEYYLKGKIWKEGDKIFIQADLIDTLENKVLDTYKVTESLSYPQKSIYVLCDKLIETISRYKGIASSKIVFVKRTAKEDRLYISDFSKENPYLLRKADLILFPKFSKSGNKLAYLVYENHKYFLEIYDLRSSSYKKIYIDGLCSAPLWLITEEELILTIEKRGIIGIYRYNLGNQKLDPLIETEEGILQAGSISPEGNLLSYVYGKRAGNPQIYLFNLETLKSYKIPQKRKYNTSPRFSPKGNQLLFLSREGNISFLILYDLKTNQSREIKFVGNLEDPTFSPTGDYILAFGKGKEGTGIYLIHLDSSLSYLYLPGSNFIFPDWTKL